VDLSHTLHPAMPYWPGAGYGPFRYAAINVLERDGKAAGVFEMPEHMGRTWMRPNHFVDSPLSVDRLLQPTCCGRLWVFDIAARAAADAGALLSVDDVVASEHRLGPVAAGAVALVRSGWSARWPDPSAFQNGMRFPAILRRRSRPAHRSRRRWHWQSTR